MKKVSALVVLLLSTVQAFAQEGGTIAGQVVADPGTFPVLRARVFVANAMREILTDAAGAGAAALWRRRDDMD